MTPSSPKRYHICPKETKQAPKTTHVPEGSAKTTYSRSQTNCPDKYHQGFRVRSFGSRSKTCSPEVCQEARCPNAGECWSAGTATALRTRLSEGLMQKAHDPMELGEGGDPWNSIYGSTFPLWGRRDKWNQGIPPPEGRGDSPCSGRVFSFFRL